MMTRSKMQMFVMALILGSPGCGFNESAIQEENVKRTWGNVESAYQRRADLIPNLVEVVKGYAAHEHDVLTEVTQARATATQTKLSVDDLGDPAKVKQFQEAQGQLSSVLSRLLAIQENYPNLKADGAFRDLQAQIEGSENRINVERTKYNEAVASYNTVVRTFPSGCGASMRGLKTREPFQAQQGSENAPKVKF